MTKQYESEVLASVHEAALDLVEAGVMSKRTMKAFDERCLTPVEDLAPEEIREIRLRENASQAVFARYLNVTTGLVSQWGAWREAPARRVVEAPDAGGEERSRGRSRDGCRPGRAAGARPFPSGAISGENGSGHLVLQRWRNVESTNAEVSINCCES